MYNSEKKAVILKDFSSPYIYQAIVILNEEGVFNESRALKDAEKIVSDYIQRTKKEGTEDIILYSRSEKPQYSEKSINIPVLLLLGTFIAGVTLLVSRLF